MKKKKMFFIVCLLSLGLISYNGCSPTSNVSHSHSFQNNWSYDEEYHWHSSTCGHPNSEVKEKHTFDEGSTIDSTFEKEGSTTYTCTTCGYKKITTIEKLEHNYSNEWSYNETSHWHSCLDKGYEDLKSDVATHTDSNEIILTPSTSTETGLAQYTCSICGHIYQKVLLIDISIISLPIITTQNIYVGQTLSQVSFAGGQASVDGLFEWTNPNEIITGNGEYSISFIPTESDKYATVTDVISLNTIQLTISISIGDHGSANYEGITNVNYGSNLEIIFSPDSGYQVSEIIVDGTPQSSSLKYEFINIISNHTLEVTFEEKPSFDNLSFRIECLSGSQDCYTITENTITFTTINNDSIYSISGEFNGNIIIDTGETYDFDLELHGFTLTCSTINPITILSGNNTKITAKSGYSNYIYDNRETIDATDTTLYSGAIYSLADLDIKGKGSLTIISENNNGIHTKDDLEVKNLTLSVTCVDNALKGNDSVTLTNCNATLIATKGDGIKTSNSDISEKGNQRGIITITGGTYNIYAACDGIDASYNVEINDSSTNINIYTDKYSEYSEEVTAVSNSIYYIRCSSSSYSYSIKYLNSTTSEYAWANAEYYTYQSRYYFYKIDKLSGYDKYELYMYSSNQTQGQDSSYYKKFTGTINDSYDTLAISTKNGNVSWTNYTTSSNNDGMGGMQEGNTDKGDYSTKGIKAANEITINNGTIYIQAYDDAIHANSDVALENSETPTGNININDGNIYIESNDDGIHSDGTLTIVNGVVNVAKSYEGLEGLFVYIQGGNTSVISLDDGINGTNTTDTPIIISGGSLYIYAAGDGIDSNSTSSYNGILFSGGNTVVICNSNGNSAIDTDNGYSFTGGSVVALTTSGGMSNESTKCSNFSSVATKSSLSLNSGQYLVIKVNSITKVIVKMPCSMSAIAIYLGNSSASLSSSSSCNETLDSNGVYWNT